MTTAGEPATARPWFAHTRVLPFAPGSYAAVHAQQQRLLEERIAAERDAGGGTDVLLVGEHERVITLGRGTKVDVGALPIPVVAIERGGQATWHGPGQLVVYPIVALAPLRLSIRAYLRALEEAIVRALAPLGVAASWRDGATGVWVGQRKVASIGVAVRRHVTWHGLALNVAPDLADFRLIQPCGFAPDVMTSLADLAAAAGRPAPDFADVKTRVVRELITGLGLAPPIWEPAEG